MDGVQEHSRKRPVSIDSQLCIICQKDSSQKLMTVTSDGLHSADAIRQLQLKLQNDNFRDATDRLTSICDSNMTGPFSWHKDCRSNYMSKSKIERLKKLGFKDNNTESMSSSVSHSNPQNTSLRSRTPRVDWMQCIFCQQDQKESLHLIQEMTVSSRILEAAKYDSSSKVKLACVDDLTAADGRYHRSCFVKFERRTKRMSHISLNSPVMT